MTTKTNFILNNNLLFLLLISLIFVISCAKESIVGPRGEKGETGLDGTDGIDGIDGKDGQDGNPDMEIFEFAVSDSNWVDSGTALSPDAYSFYTYSNSSITLEKIKTGAVMVYQDLPGDITVPLPRTMMMSGIQVNLSYETGPGFIKLKIMSADFQHVRPDEEPANFRAVFIPKSALIIYPDLDLNDYNSVKKAFQFAD